MAQKPMETPQAHGVAYIPGFFDFAKIVFFMIFAGSLILFVFFFVLNYFNILSVSSIYPEKLGWLPHIGEKKDSINNLTNADQKPDISFDSGRNLWAINGIVSDISADNITITSGSTTLELGKDKTISCLREIDFFPDINNTKSPASTSVITFCSDVVKGKKVKAEYNTEKSGVNKLIEITLK